MFLGRILITHFYLMAHLIKANLVNDTKAK